MYYRVTNKYLEYFSWEAIDPLQSLFCSYFQPTSLLAFQLVILFSGSYLYARHTLSAEILSKGKSPTDRTSVKTAVLIGLSVILIAGSLSHWQAYLLNYHWFPMLLVSSKLMGEAKQAGRQVLAISFFAAIAWLWIATSGSLACWGLILAFLNTFLLSGSILKPLAGVAHGTALLYAFYSLGLAVSPDYLPGTRLSNDPTLSLPPMMGPEIKADFLNWHNIQKAFLIFLVEGAAFLALLLLALRRKTKYFYYLSLGVISLGIGYLGLISLKESPSFGHYDSLLGIVPGLALSKLPQLVLALPLTMAFLGVLSVLNKEGVFRIFCLSSLLSLGVFGFIQGSSNLSSLFQSIEVLQKIERLAPVLQANSYVPISRKEALAKNRFKQTDKLFHQSKKSAIDFTDFERLKFTKGNSISAQATTRNDLALLALDGNLLSKWTSSKAQKKGDALYLRFEKPTTFSRLIISNKGSRGHFPRHFSLVSEGKVIADFSPWGGASMLTPSGLPYFGSKNHMVVDLPAPVTVSSLDISITKSDPHIWSVHEVKFFKPKL